ncbi:MAG TPA: DUF4389 domain-containing protein [Dehalococcoidia bacterium]|nr:DUF4389 domain-containing protein [Dehalococcoidia bacterium]
MSDTVHYDVPYPAQLNRVTTLLRIFMLIPHMIVLAVLGVCMEVVTVIAWFAILITGKYPRGMWDFSLSVARYAARVSSYGALLRDEYPPFGGGGDYPLQYELAYSEPMNRLSTLLRIIYAIPHIIVLYLLGIALEVITFIAWWAILFTGKYPQGMFTFAVGVSRWQQRASAYVLLLTDAYPPFSMEPGPAAPGYATGMA